MRKITRFLIACFIAFVLAMPGTSFAASKIYGFTALAGAGTGALGAIDGAALLNKDMAVGVVDGIS